jgi:hypothetical protein
VAPRARPTNEACQCQRVATCRQQRGMGMRHRAPTGNIPISSLPFSHQTGKTQSNLCASVHWTFQSYPNVLIGSPHLSLFAHLFSTVHRSENFILKTTTPVGEFYPLHYYTRRRILPSHAQPSYFYSYLFFGERHSPRSPSPIDLGTGEQ